MLVFIFLERRSFHLFIKESQNNLFNISNNSFSFLKRKIEKKKKEKKWNLEKQ